MSTANLQLPKLGGVAELEGVEIHGMTRSAFILRGALAAGAVYGASTVGPFVRQALAQGGGGDVDVLNFALTLEHLEADFYRKAEAQAKLEGALRSLAQEIGQNEQEHVDTLTQTIEDLGGKPASAPKTTFPMRDRTSFLKLAETLEDTGVQAYNGAAPGIKSMEVLSAAGAIVQVEARHAAAIRLEAGRPPAPDAFDKTAKREQALGVVRPFLQ